MQICWKNKFSPKKIFNVDETGISSVHTPPKVIASKKLKQIGGITSTERGFNTTLIACINAVGNSVPPVFVFPRVNFKNHMLAGAPPGSHGTCNPSGWSTGEIFLEFLEHFIKHVKPDKESKVLLIMDNHESHVTVEAIYKARDNGVVLFTIPPHTSHKLQPMDRGVFGPFKANYNEACKNWLLSNPGKPLTIYDVAAITGKAYPLAFTPTNIISGFSSSGLWPINQNIFPDADYFASLVSDRPNPEPNAKNDASCADHLGNNRPSPNVNLESAAKDNVCAGPSGEVMVTPTQQKKVSIQIPKPLEEIMPFPKNERKKLTNKGKTLESAGFLLTCW